MRLHIGKAFNSLKLTDYLEEEEFDSRFIRQGAPLSFSAFSVSYFFVLS